MSQSPFNSVYKFSSDEWATAFDGVLENYTIPVLMHFLGNILYHTHILYFKFTNYIQVYANTDFQIFTKKEGVLPRLPEYPPLAKLNQNYIYICRTIMKITNLVNNFHS